MQCKQPVTPEAVGGTFDSNAAGHWAPLSSAQITQKRPYVTFNYDFSANYSAGDTLFLLMSVDGTSNLWAFGFNFAYLNNPAGALATYYDGSSQSWNGYNVWLPTNDSNMILPVTGTLTMKWASSSVEFWIGTDVSQPADIVYEKGNVYGNSGLGWPTNYFQVWGITANAAPFSPADTCNNLTEASTGSINLSPCEPGQVGNFLFMDSPLACCLGLASPQACGACAPYQKTGICDHVMEALCKPMQGSSQNLSPFCNCLNAEALSTLRPQCFYSPCVNGPAYKIVSPPPCDGTICLTIFNDYGKYDNISNDLFEQTCAQYLPGSSTGSKTVLIVLIVLLVGFILAFLGVYFLMK